MMTQDRDYEDALRRALTAAAESIEPAGDGLQRIRHRLDSPRPRSILSACTEWLELRGTRFLIRLEPVTEAARTALGRSGPLAALVSFLRGLLSPHAARRAGRAGGHRGAAGSPGRLGRAGPWLKPLFAVSAAVAIVVVGVVILNHETGTLISPLNSVTSPSSQSPSFGSGGKTANSKRWVLPLGVRTGPPSGQERYPHPKSALTVPVVACTPTPTPTPASTTTAPAGTPSPSPTPTPSATSTSPATPQPTDTGQPSPSPTSSPATSAATATTTAIIWRGDRAGGGAPIVECGG
jgi:hypothetical protein